MTQKLQCLSVYPGENGGHRVLHEFKSQAMKGKGDLYMDRPKSAEHNFGPGQEKEVMAHIGKALRFAKPAGAEEEEA